VRITKERSNRRNKVSIAFTCLLVLVMVIIACSWWDNDIITTKFLPEKIETAVVLDATATYNPTACQNMIDGHCDDEDGGAWSYRNSKGKCAHTEQNAPRAWRVTGMFYDMFHRNDTIKSVLDFGGGLGVYLLDFRQKGHYSPQDLVTMEPYPLGDCLFANLTQDTTNLLATPLSKVPENKYDLVMTIEVLEHIPAQHHTHVVQALCKMTSKYLFFSAAHPGQSGEGHVGPSMKTRDEWVAEIIAATPSMQVDKKLTDALWEASPPGTFLHRNAVILRKTTTSTHGA
jgi:hypothetical protein